jgi:hypothetical protein
VREPSREENSRGLGERRFATVFYVMAEAMTRKATTERKAAGSMLVASFRCEGLWKKG